MNSSTKTPKIEEVRVGFLPTKKCPLCNEMHIVTYTYKGHPVLSCPKMEKGKIYFTNTEEE